MNVTNEPLNMQPPTSSMSLARFVHNLEASPTDERDFEAEWQLKLLQLALNRDAEAMQVSPSLLPNTRRILTAMAEAVIAARAAARNPLLVSSASLQRVQALRDVLADQADPVISTIALCRKVTTFGVYDEMSDEGFPAGRPLQTIVYSEIRNFRSEQTDDDRFKTVLGTRLEVLSLEGRSMWQHEEREIVDLCRRRRTDFFLAQRVTIPPTLPVGQYVLKVLVEDKLSGRANEATRRFSVGAPVSLTARWPGQ